MRIDIIGRHMDVTNAIRAYAEGKVDRLTKFFDGTQMIHVVLEQGKHAEFSVEIRVDVQRHADFISHAKGHDLYAAIDECADKAARQVREFKDKLKHS